MQPLGPRNLLLVSALLLSWTIVCIVKLSAWSQSNLPGSKESLPSEPEGLIGGSIWAGIPMVIRSPYLLGICLLMLLFTTLATFLYLMQAQIIRDAFTDSAQRTAVFTPIDLGATSA